MNILIAPDSFKGTLPATEAAHALAAAARSVFPEARLLVCPMADGGEGSSSIAARAVSAERIELEVVGPEYTTVSGFYYLKDNLALIELAAASGYSLSRNPKGSAKFSSTYGSGQLILDAVQRGATKIYLFLGGSATSDAGTGIARALGTNFFDSTGNQLGKDASTPFGGSHLSSIHSYDDSILKETLKEVEVSAIVDVENPLYGLNGAAHIYGPQKGLSKEEVLKIDSGLHQLSLVCAEKNGVDHSMTAGAGAAGGCGFAISAFCDGKLVPGAAFFLDLINFTEVLPTLDIILTGEGSFDTQSLQGKLVGKLLERCASNSSKISFLVFAGISDESALSESRSSSLSHFSVSQLDPAISKTKTAYALEKKATEVLQTLSRAQK